MFRRLYAVIFSGVPDSLNSLKTMEVLHHTTLIPYLKLGVINLTRSDTIMVGYCRYVGREVKAKVK